MIMKKLEASIMRPPVRQIRWLVRAYSKMKLDADYQTNEQSAESLQSNKQWIRQSNHIEQYEK
jgi:hypothetical protein